MMTFTFASTSSHLAVCIFVASTFTVVAQNNDAVVFYGSGTASCGNWLAAREATKTNPQDGREVQMMEWLVWICFCLQHVPLTRRIQESGSQTC